MSKTFLKLPGFFFPCTVVGLLLPENNTEGGKCSRLQHQNWGRFGSNGSNWMELWGCAHAWHPVRNVVAAPGAAGVRLGAVSGSDPGQVSVSLWGLAPHAEFKQDQGDRCCILSTLRVSVPPRRFPAGM